MSQAKVTIPRGSVEYVTAEVEADVTLDDTVTVEVSVDRGTHSWLAAEWTGTAGTTRSLRTSTPVTFSTGSYPAANYSVFVRVTDNPEVVVLSAGTLSIAG